MTHFVKLWTYRELLYLWTRREVSVRYKQSLLGVAWAIFQPAVLAAVFSLVFSYLARIPSDGIPYPLFAYVALVPWTYFSTSIIQGIPSLANRMNLVTKAAFPREILPMGVIGAGLVDFLCAFVVFCLMLIYFQVPINRNVFWLPLLIMIQMSLSLGVVFLGSALNVFYRDIRFVVPIGVQIWMYATPIVYPLSLVPSRLQHLLALNPMVGLIESYRNVFVRGISPAWPFLIPGAFISLALLVVGYTLFKRLEPAFADVI